MEAKEKIGFRKDQNPGHPGIFAIVCLPKNKVFFGEAGSMWLDLGRAYSQLQNQNFQNPELVRDWLELGESCFDFRVIVLGVAYFDEATRKNAIQQAKKEWVGGFY